MTGGKRPRDRDAGPVLDRREGDTTPVVDLHEPIARELAEPEDGYEPPPTWLLFFVLAVMGFGGWYLGMYSGGFDPSVYDERGWTRGPAPAAEPATAGVDPMVLGRRVYNNCMACHQRDGGGVAGNYPPLDGSEWVGGSPDALAALVLHGLQGPIEVAGQTYNQVMPQWGHLSDEQIAAVLTYVRGSWGNRAPPVSSELVAAVRAATDDRRQPWTVEELRLFRGRVAARATDRGEPAPDASG